MFIDLMLPEEMVNYIRDHFENHLQEEQLLRVTSGNLNRQAILQDIIIRFNDALLADAIHKVASKRTAKIEDSKSEVGAAFKNASMESNATWMRYGLNRKPEISSTLL